MDEAFFRDEGDGRFTATELTRGPWDDRAQHAGPPCALLARCLEVAHPREGAQVARFTAEILGPVPLGALEVRTEVLRPGRSIELLGASARHAGREVLRATAWRLRTEEIGLAAPAPERPSPPAPQDLPPGGFFAGAAEVGYHTAVDVRFAEGGWNTAGPAVAWLRMMVPLVADEAPSPLVRVLAAADSGNGISAVAHPRSLLFVNTDLTVTLHRQPEGEWVLLDARTVIEPHGIGQATSVLSDGAGVLGGASQTLFVARR